MVSKNYKILILSVLIFAFVFYSTWLYVHLPINQLLINESADKGKMVWQKYNCNSCHQIYGLGGYLGPDLTNEYSKYGDERIIAFLKNGTTTMPKFAFNEGEVQSLIAFLKQLDSSGESNPRSYKIYKNGCIQKK